MNATQAIADNEGEFIAQLMVGCVVPESELSTSDWAELRSAYDRGMTQVHRVGQREPRIAISREILSSDRWGPSGKPVAELRAEYEAGLSEMSASLTADPRTAGFQPKLWLVTRGGRVATKLVRGHLVEPGQSGYRGTTGHQEPNTDRGVSGAQVESIDGMCSFDAQLDPEVVFADGDDLFLITAYDGCFAYPEES